MQAPGSNGFSNETILCRTRTAGGEEKRLVVRVAPTKHLLFLDARVLDPVPGHARPGRRRLGRPPPPLGWYEEDPQYFGVPFFSMDHVEGLVPSDNIPYTMDGWVIEATPEQQERMWWSGIDALAAVHRPTGGPPASAAHMPTGAGRGWSSSSPITGTSSTGPPRVRRSR